MKYRFLGRTGLKVSNIALGTGSFGTTWGYGAPSEAARTIYHDYRPAGGNFIDTADFYQFTQAETLLADLIAGERDGAKHVARLDAVSEVPLGTPYSYPANNRARFANGHPE